MKWPQQNRVHDCSLYLMIEAELPSETLFWTRNNSKGKFSITLTQSRHFMGLSSVKVWHRNIVPRGRACPRGTFLFNFPYVLGYRWQKTKPGRTSLVSWVLAHLQAQPTRWGNTTLKTCWLSSVISTVAVSTHSRSSTRWKHPPRRRIARQLLCLPQVRFCHVIL